METVETRGRKPGVICKSGKGSGILFEMRNILGESQAVFGARIGLSADGLSVLERAGKLPKATSLPLVGRAAYDAISKLIEARDPRAMKLHTEWSKHFPIPFTLSPGDLGGQRVREVVERQAKKK